MTLVLKLDMVNMYHNAKNKVSYRPNGQKDRQYENISFPQMQAAKIFKFEHLNWFKVQFIVTKLPESLITKN